MSLTPAEKAHVRGQLYGRLCECCGSTDFRVDDHGLPDDDGWGVRGAYVACDDCGRLIRPPTAQWLTADYWMVAVNL